MQNKEIILLAGGTGFIGKHLVLELEKEYQVRVLTRNKKQADGNKYFYWNPDREEIDERVLDGVTTIINLCGAGIADHRWTIARKRELEHSRTKPASLLFSKIHLLPDLKHYISASGVNCYPTDQQGKIFHEEDAFGNDFVSQLVKKWEEAADLFEAYSRVLKLRFGFVFASGEGGLKKMEKPIKLYVGSVLGSGKQVIPWIHLHDLIRLIKFSMGHRLAGVYHAVGGNTTNEELTYRLAKKLHRKILLPTTPGLIIQLIFGEMSELLLKGIEASNEKIRKEGFVFEKDFQNAFDV